MKIIPKFTISDIQLDVGDHEFKKAFSLYEKDAVHTIKSDFSGYHAVVSGTQDYRVYVSAKSFDVGDCNCYIGQKGELCKHMLALAIAVVYTYRPTDTEIVKQPLDQAVCSHELRDITKDEVVSIKAELSKGFSLIKGYSGPSSKWFQYQDRLAKGSRLILLALSKLPVCEKSANKCILILKRLDAKLLKGGIDDSNGTMGDLMINIVELLNMFATSDVKLKKYINNHLPKGEVFNWEAGFKAS